MTKPGWIIVLNGAPRSGKSSIAAAVQNQLAGTWINLGVDTYRPSLPEALQPGIGLRPGGERPDLEPAIQTLYAALYQSIAAHARLGLHVVVDLGHHDGYSKPLNILPQCARQLSGLPALLIGIECPLETILTRRAADPNDDRYVAPGTKVPADVQRWQDTVHNPGIYDLRLDTSKLTPEAAANAIGHLLAAGPKQPSAFTLLAAK